MRATSSRDGAGLLLMVVSAACFALMAAFAKLFLSNAPEQALVFSRAVFMTLFFAAFARLRGVSLRGSRPTRLILRGLLGYGAISCYFYSVRHLPVGDAVLIQYSNPIFVSLLSPLLLHESSGRGHWPLVLTALVGVALVVGFSGDLRSSCLVGLGGSLFSGLAYVTIRDLQRTEHSLTILFWFPAVMIPGSLLGVLHAGAASIPRDAREWVGHATVIASGLLGQLTLTEGLARVHAARGTAVTMSGPLFGLLFGWLMFDDSPSTTSWMGTMLVVGALSLLAWVRPEPAKESANLSGG